MSGANIAPPSRYAMSGTDIGYAVSPYALAVKYPAMLLPAPTFGWHPHPPIHPGFDAYCPTNPYTVSGTSLAYGAAVYLPTNPYTVSGTSLPYGATVYLPMKPYAVSSTSLPYGATVVCDTQH
eukprot:3145710-Rhodomonas_salina.1